MASIEDLISAVETALQDLKDGLVSEGTIQAPSNEDSSSQVQNQHKKTFEEIAAENAEIRRLSDIRL